MIVVVTLFCLSAAAIYLSCEFFVNGVEWLGRRLNLAATATGTVLAAFGTAGAQRLIEMLQQELVQTAAAAGCARLSDINKTTVKANFV